MSETCNSRHFSWLMKSCFPSPNDKSLTVAPIPLRSSQPQVVVSLLPDDILLECLSRVPSADIPAVSAVCRRWHALLLSPSFFLLRRHRLLLSQSIFAFSVTESGVFVATLQFGLHPENPNWEVSLCLSPEAFPLPQNATKLAAIGPRIYVISRDSMLRYDAWTQTVISRSSMTFRRKKFASAVIADKIYVAGGGGSRVTTAVEEYDPEIDTWRTVSHVPRKRYGCLGAAVDGIFYIIGGLKIREISENEISRVIAAPGVHLFASSMDLYDVETGAWLRSRAVPGGGCVVAACAAAGHVYVLTSHAVELSFWRFDGRRRNGNHDYGGGAATFGEWCRMKSPPMPTQVRLDSTVRFSFVGVGDKVVLIQVVGCIDDLLRRSGRSERGLREGLVLVYDPGDGEWSRAADLPELIRRAACVSVEC